MERERLKREREDRNKAEAELKMLQHWKINNPQVKAVNLIEGITWGYIVETSLLTSLLCRLQAQTLPR